MKPLYSAPAGGLRLICAIIGVEAVIAVAAAASLAVAGAGALPALTTLAIAAAAVFVVWLIIPRRYEVWPDRLCLVFPLFGWSIGYASVAEANAAKWWQPYGFWGLRFATSPGQAVVIQRHQARLLGRPNLVISPAERGPFVSQLQQALARYRAGTA